MIARGYYPAAISDGGKGFSRPERDRDPGISA